MNSTGFLSARKKILLASLAFLALLLASGTLTTPTVAAFSGGSSSPSNFNPVAFSSTDQTSASTAKLMGTTSITASSGSTSAPTSHFIPTNSLDDKSRPTLVAGNTALSQDPSSAASASSSLRSSSDGIANNPRGLTSAPGVNAFDSGTANGGLDVEPPDQGLCAGNGFTIDAVNLVLKVYTSSFKPVSSDIALATLVGFRFDQQLGVSSVGGGYILSDPRCMYDALSGHWFLSFLYLGGPGVFSAGGPFPLPDYAYEFVLASQTGSPLGGWNVYIIDVSSDPSPGLCPCFGDQPLLGADAFSLIISTNAFPIFTGGFYGAQVYLFDKLGMAQGLSSVNVVHFDIGQTINPPDGSCLASGGLYCFYSVNPADSPTVSSYDFSNGGTAWALSSLDFTGAGDTRIAVWSFSDTSSLLGTTPSITLTLYLGQGLEFYQNPGGLVPQKTGPIPLGDVVYSNQPALGCHYQCPEGGLASNGDGLQGSVVYAQGALWGAVSTFVNEGTPFKPNFHVGAAFWVINAHGGHVSLANQGYVAARNEELIFPSIGVGPSGNALMVFTLTGQNYYPSTAFTVITKSPNEQMDGGGNSVAIMSDSQGSNVRSGVIYVADLGKSPQDGFTEYQSLNTNSSAYRPRWGDYTWAVWANGKIYFSSEYIQSPNCSDQAFINDPTCGGTRDPFANWGTSLNSVPVWALQNSQ